MTRKDFIMLAEAVNEALTRFDRPNHNKAVREVAKNIATKCKTSNPRFDRQRFLRACGVSDD